MPEARKIQAEHFLKASYAALLHYWRCRLLQRGKKKEETIKLICFSPQSSCTMGWTVYISIV